MADWTYTDFPVTPDPVPLHGSGDTIQTLQANELREAVLRRGTQIGISPSVPDEVDDLSVCYYEWLTQMRIAIEELISSGKFCRWGTDYFPAWTKSTLLQYVHTTWIDNALITTATDWMDSADADSALAGFEDHFGNLTFTETGDNNNQVSGYEGINSGTSYKGIHSYWMDAANKFYVSVVSVGGGQFRIDFFKAAARASGDKLGHTANFGAGGGGTKTITQDNSSGMVGTIVVTEPGGGWIADNDIAVAVDFDESIMYGAHINELYYAIECLCITKHSVSKGSISTEGKNGTDTGSTPQDAFDAGYADFNATSYSAGGSGMAVIWSDLEQISESSYYYYVSNERVIACHIAVPNVAYKLREFFVPAELYSPSSPVDLSASCDEGSASLVGSLATGPSGSSAGYIKAYNSSSGGWDNETIHLRYGFGDTVDPGPWGPDTQTHMWSATFQTSWPDSGPKADCFGRSDFDGYSNGAYSPYGL